MWIAITLFAVVVAGVSMGPLPEWYLVMEKPSWTPPGWVFGPVWTVLYITMAGASQWVWKRSRRPEERAWAMWAYGVQLALNALWPLLFFRLGLMSLALAEILLLWLAIVATVVLFWRALPAAGALLIPYLLWVTYAATLNAGFVWLAQ